jgi:hypothetical protein
VGLKHVGCDIWFGVSRSGEWVYGFSGLKG